ncbi:MAG: NAD(P)/FAD-dependent oxidoreductase [Chloroflexota bacterium]|nr:NAD(P)/FAD-dependent oxidoreductase [Chloroflexota bacterium]
MSNDYDVIVIGAGHNGLTAAGYMAKAGLKTLVLEKRDRVGGACVTEEIVPGFRFNLGATALAAWLRPGVIRDLELERFGLGWEPMDPLFTTPFPDGNYLTIYQDIERTCQEIARFSTQDAQAYRRFMGRWATFKRYLDPILTNNPTHLEDMEGGLVTSVEILDIIRDLLFTSVKEGMDEAFENDYVKSTILSFSLGSSYLGPSAATFSTFVLHFCMCSEWRWAKGGMGSITQAMTRAVEHYGGTIRTGAEVERVLINDGTATGVRLSTGEEITAGMILSNADTRQTLLKMVGGEHLTEASVKEIKRNKCEATGVTLNLALSELPDFGFPEELLNGGVSICPSWRYVEKAFYEYTVKEIPEKPLEQIWVTSYADRSMAPPGKHTLSMFVYPIPYELSRGNWTERKEECFDRAIDVLAEYAPNIKRSVISWYGLTPVELEEEFSLPRGDLAQGLWSWDELMSFKPVMRRMEFRTPIVGLYLCGASTQPGGGVSAGAGRNAAQVALQDRQAITIDELASVVENQGPR